MNLKKIIRILIFIFGYSILGFGIYISLIILTGGFTLFDTLIMCAVPILTTYLVFFYPVIVIVLIRLHQKKSKIYILPILLGIAIVTINFLPFTGIPQTITSGNTQFENVFGVNYMDKIPESLKSKFKPQPFDLWQMYNFHDDFNCNFTKDCGPYLIDPFANDSFYFDYYCPPTGSGPFPTIINIHGGGWVIGNKGAPENRPMASRYLAQQGYAIVDIQYGLTSFPEDPLANGALEFVQSLLGRQMLNRSYTVSEIVVQILGNLTDYLVDHAAEYKINTSCVYVTGNSAGGHLTGMFLGYNNTYREIFNPGITLKGLILFYCPSNLTDLYNSHKNDPLNWIVDLDGFMAKMFGGTPENNASLFDSISPVALVDSSAPPCLILHGEKDKMVPFVEGQQLKQALDAAGRPAIFLTFPYQGHAFDYSFNSYGGQISLYFMERFLAATQYCI